MRRLIVFVVFVVFALVPQGSMAQKKQFKETLQKKGLEDWSKLKPAQDVMWPPDVITIASTGKKTAVVIARWNEPKSPRWYYFDAALVSKDGQDTCPGPCKTLAMMSMRIVQDTPGVKFSLPPDTLKIFYNKPGEFVVTAEWCVNGKVGGERVIYNKGAASMSAESELCEWWCPYPSKMVLAKVK